MSDLNFDSFQRFMAESHTEEGRKRQEADSMRSLIQHGRATDLEVEDDEGAEASVPQPLKRAGRQDGAARDNDPPPPARTAPTVQERWAALKEQHGTWGNR